MAADPAPIYVIRGLVPTRPEGAYLAPDREAKLLSYRIGVKLPYVMGDVKAATALGHDRLSWRDVNRKR